MNIGILELLLLLVVVVLFFGTGKLTRAMGDMARGVRSFRDGMKDIAPEADVEMSQADERAGAAPPKALPAPHSGSPGGEAAAVDRTDQPARP